MTDEEKELLKKSLFKKATGYTVTEETEEYAMDKDGNLTPVKKKTVTKEVPPELAAIKTLLDEEKEKDNKEFSEEELIAERNRLLKILFDEYADATNKK